MPKEKVDYRAMARRAGRITLSFLIINALIGLSTAPLWAVGLYTDPARTWPVLAALSILMSPALAATFTVFGTGAVRKSRAGALDEPRRVVGIWWRAWRRSLVGAAVAGAILAVIVVIAVVNIGAFLGSAAAILVTAFNAVVAFLATSTVLHLLVLLAESSIDLPWRTRVQACLALPVRRLHLTVVGLVALLTAGSVILELAPVGFLVTLAPLVWVGWLAFRTTLRPVIPEA